MDWDQDIHRIWVSVWTRINKDYDVDQGMNQGTRQDIEQDMDQNIIQDDQDMDSGMNYAGACDQDLARMHIRIGVGYVSRRGIKFVLGYRLRYGLDYG